jgi:hypothetical protein
VSEEIQRRGDRPKPGEPGFVDMRSKDGKRGYSWPKFTCGNQMSVTHGASVPAIVDPVAEELVRGLLEDRPDLERFPEATWAWARAESRCLLLAQYQAEHGLIGADGKESVSARLVNQCERMADQLRQRLGLDPKSEAELAASQADAARSVVDLDTIRERGRRALDRRRGLASSGEAGHVRDGEEER